MPAKGSAVKTNPAHRTGFVFDRGGENARGQQVKCNVYRRDPAGKLGRRIIAPQKTKICEPMNILVIELGVDV